MKISVFAEHIFEAAEQEGCSVRDILKTAKGRGIDGVELDYARISADDGPAALIKSAGMEIACVYAFFDFSHNTDMSYPESVIKTLEKHGIKRLMAIPGFIEKNDNKEKCIRDMTECMNKLSEIAQKAGISLCLEDFDDEKAVFATSAGLLKFMNNVKNLGCAFDTGNFIYSGEAAETAFELLEKHIVHVHCKDRCLEPKEGELPKITLENIPLYSSPVGYGAIGIEKIVKKLLKNGYDGWFAIEHFGSQHQLSDIKKSAEKLKEWYNDTCNNME